MTKEIDIISKKITLLNQTALYSMSEKDSKVIIKNFTETGIKILEADFGWAWWKFSEEDNFRLAYKSPKTPYTPATPREKAGNHIAMKTKKPFFDSDVKKENYKDSTIYLYMKSYIIIPIYFGEHIYGTVVLCYKKKHKFTEDEITLANAVGNSIAQSITIHRLMENERDNLIAQEKQKATELLLNEEKLKTQFIANTTHEFRTPLAIIRGNVGLALNKKDLKSAMEALKLVNNETIQLSSMLADLALLTSGKDVRGAISPLSLNIKEILTDLSKRLKPIADKKSIGISFKNKVPNINIRGDFKYIDRLFLNLIENAIIYGKDKGKVEIQVTDNQKTAAVKISDNGVGISKEDLPYIFERFYRADKAHSAYGQHSGLGLAIVKWIVDIHGGKIEVESTKGKGTAFTVTFPKATK